MPKNKEFRGLTIFELSLILLVVGSVFYWAFATKKTLQNNLDDALRKSRVIAAKEHLRAYILENDSFPSTETYQDDEARKSIFEALIIDEGEDALDDPKIKDLKIDYLAEPAGCAENTENPCTRVALSLTLSNGQDFYRFAIKPGTESEQLKELQESDDTEELDGINEQDLLEELNKLQE